MSNKNRVVFNLNDTDLEELNEAAYGLELPRATLVKLMVQQSLKRLNENTTAMDVVTEASNA